MNEKIFDAVKLKRKLQESAERKIADLDQEQLLSLLRNKFGSLTRQRKNIYPTTEIK